MSNVEKSFWYHLDNRLVRGNLVNFVHKCLDKKDADDLQPTLLVKQYNKIKKTIPTAGIMYFDSKTQSLLVVKIRGAKIWSMPKGKKEQYEKRLCETACREFFEETGIAVSLSTVAQRSPIIIARTTFFLVESTVGNTVRFSSAEIAEATFVDLTSILQHPSHFSKQTRAVAAYLQGLL